MTLAPTWWEALTKKIPGENENFMHVGDSHHKLTIWYHIIGTKYSVMNDSR